METGASWVIMFETTPQWLYNVSVPVWSSPRNLKIRNKNIFIKKKYFKKFNDFY